MQKLPTELKKQKGTLKKIRVLPNEIKAKPIDYIPAPPPNIEKDETKKRVWYDAVQWLHSVNILHLCDLHAIEMYCHEYGMYLKAVGVISEQGETVSSPNGYNIPSPWMSIQNTAFNNSLKLGSAFGMNPIARTRIGGQNRKEENHNPILRMMNK